MTLWLGLILLATNAPAPQPSPASQPTAANAEADDTLGDNDTDDEEAVENATPDAENESAQAAAGSADTTLLYTRDLSDAELDHRFCGDLASLGSISVGFADAGRLIGGVHMPEDPAWQVVVPDYAWGTSETIEFLRKAALAVKEQFPDAPPLRINHIGKKDGGWVRPHKSHQSGRDVDLGFYYIDGAGPGGRRGDRTRFMDLGLNWALLKAIATETDVQLVLTDRKVQKVLRDYAVTQGEDPVWVASILGGTSAALAQHARRHRDHFHVRFFAARSQELGRRVQPILAKRPEENLTAHRVRSGDTLGALARKYGSTVAMIQKANGMRGTFLHLGQVLNVPLRGPCTHCPLPAAVVVPPRRLPPETAVIALDETLDERGRGEVSTASVRALLPPVP